MKIALIVTDKFKDYHLLATKLDELQADEIVSGTTNGYEMLQEYIQTRAHVKVSKASGHSVISAYNAIKEAEKVVIFSNGDGSRTERSIANAINKKKNLKIYAYKSKAFDIKQDGNYAKISLSGNLQKATNIEGVFLNKDEVKNLMDSLSKIYQDL